MKNCDYKRISMDKKNKIDELENKLRAELEHWINSLPHYSNMQLIYSLPHYSNMHLILEQYSKEYLQRVNVINNISINAEKADPELITFLLNENNALDLLLKIKNCNAGDLFKHSVNLKFYQK